MHQKNLQDIIKKLSSAILNSCYVFDNARASEKMLNPNYVGKNNIAWKKGPYLLAKRGGKQINHTHEYCIATSDEFRIASGLVDKYIPSYFEKNGGRKIDIPKANENDTRVESIISKLSMIEQFEIYKDFAVLLYGHDIGPYNIGKAKKMKQYFSDEDYDLLTLSINRRNELTHEYDCKKSTMIEAVVYSSTILHLANIIYNIHKEKNTPVI